MFKKQLLILSLVLVMIGGTLSACQRKNAPHPTETPKTSTPLSPTQPPLLSPTATPTNQPSPTPITPTPTLTPTPIPTPTPTSPPYPVHSGTPLPPLTPIGAHWNEATLVAEYIPDRPGTLLRGSVNDILAIYGDRVEVYQGSESKPRIVFHVQVDPFLEHLSVGKNLLAVAKENQIEIYSSQGQLQDRLTPPHKDDVIRSVALSPDGHQIAYSTWQWGQKTSPFYVVDLAKKQIVFQKNGTPLFYSSDSTRLLVEDGATFRVYDTSSFDQLFSQVVGRGIVLYALTPQEDNIALVTGMFGWSRYASPGIPRLSVYKGGKPRREWRWDLWGATKMPALMTTWNPWEVAISTTGQTVGVFYRQGEGSAFTQPRYVLFDVKTGKRLQFGDWTPCPFPWVDDKGDTGCQGPPVDNPVLFRTVPIYFHAQSDGWTWAWEKWMPWTKTTTVTRQGKWKYTDKLPKWLRLNHPSLPSAGFPLWAGEGQEYQGFVLRYLNTKTWKPWVQVKIERWNDLFWEHKFADGYVATNEPLRGFAVAADDSLFAYATTNVADYLHYKRIPPRSKVYFITLKEGVAKPQPLVIQGLANRCLDQKCHIPIAICNQHYIAVAPPGHPVEIYHLPDEEMAHSFEVPSTPAGLTCTEDTLTVLDTTGTIRIFGVPSSP